MHAGLVEDLGMGEYRAAFSATAAGVYVVAVQHGGRNIAGSPFTAAVAPAAGCAATSAVLQGGPNRAATPSAGGAAPAAVCAATSAVALAPAAVTAGQQARHRLASLACTPA